ACVDWLDAAIGISAEGKRAFAPILGTGGNEGRLDYTNSFMEYLSQLLISPGQKAPVGSLLENALFGTATAGFQPSAVGQYDPGRAGGFNQGQGVEAADVPSNPWNFVLTLEGAVAWASGLYRRQGVRYKPFLCSPFTVRSTAVGYGSSTGKDGALSRAEVWAPLWSRPSRYAEVKALLREGRASLDAKPARNGLEFAQAACMLGVDRGIDGFVRYNLLKRRGDSYIALPSGRFEVTERPETALVRELAPILEETDAQLRTPPAGYESLRRQVDEAIYTLLLSGGPQALEDLASSMGRLTRWILGTAKAVRFYKRLSEKWLNSLWHLPEARIASAVAGIWHPDVGAFRNHIDRNAREFAWTGADLPERMTRALERRILLAESLGVKHNALTSAVYAGAGDAVSFLEGTLDDELIEDLVFAFTLLDWRRAGQRRAENENEVGVWPISALLKHLFLSSALATPAGDVFVTGDLAVTSALRANRIDEAAQTATRRLLNAGLLPIEAEFEAGFDGMRLAASLLIPVRYGAALRSPVLRSAATGA
ncbi:MAG: type I-U CRISPR-associated protein Csx17, partial [Acidobacteriia bacterium]|nr:type I-U CRISPR-associated protein Csx17 [Terriglobia bacterium]